MAIKAMCILIGFCEGIAVGTAFMAFITILDIVPRLIQITKTVKYIKLYEYTMIINVMIIVLIDICNISFNLSYTVIIFIGLFMGIYVGMFASALTEITNVIPIIVKTFSIYNYASWIFAALILGKVLGSLIYWIYIVK